VNPVEQNAALAIAIAAADAAASRRPPAGALTVVVGYWGAGKTTLLKRLKALHPSIVTMDEGFAWSSNPRDTQLRHSVMAGLRSGQHCAISEINYCQQYMRDRLMIEMQAVTPRPSVRWLFFENERATADRNCRRDVARLNGGESEVELNADWERVYTIPDDAIIVKMYAAP
jgi:hypothetical protein